MKNKSILSLQLLGLASIFMMSSCVQNAKENNSFGTKSSKTGWDYNKKENGGYEVHKKQNSVGGPGLLPIEGGTFVMGGSLDVDLAYEYHTPKRRVTVASFLMDETEVSNIDWLEYMHWVRHNFPNDREYYHNVTPDTLVWRRDLSYNEPYVDNYLRHPAYGDYPVVGITWEQANTYCVWRTDRVNEDMLRSKGYLKSWAEIKADLDPKNKKKKSGDGAADKKTASKGKKNSVEVPKEEEVDTILPFNTEVYLAGQYKGPQVDGKKMPVSVGAKPIVIVEEIVAKSKGSKDDKKAGSKSKGNSKKGTAKDKKGGKGGKGEAVAKTKTKTIIPKRPIGIEDGILKQPYRLPTEAEWEYAALSLVGNTDYENISDGRVYPWGGLGVRSAKTETRGLILANFKRRGGDLMGAGGYLNDKEAITAPVRSYMPNDFGLYNMAGNVSEWTADVYRQLTGSETEDLNPFRGNEFKNRKTIDDGKVRKVVVDAHGTPVREYTKKNRKLTWAEMQAEIKSQKTTKPVEEQKPTESTDSTAVTPAAEGQETAQGDGASEQTQVVTDNTPAHLKGKAFTPDVRDLNDSTTNGLYGIIHLINNESRVYKGASWNDRAYWLNPATRRHLQQAECSAEIGFRCAMTMVGKSEIYTEDKPHHKLEKNNAAVDKLTTTRRKKGVISLGGRK